MSFKGTRPTESQRQLLRATADRVGIAAIARDASISRNTALAALAGEPIHHLNLRSLLEAAVKLSTAPAANDVAKSVSQ